MNHGVSAHQEVTFLSRSGASGILTGGRVSLDGGALPTSEKWTNRSVKLLAGEADPVTVVSEKAREVVARALDEGWAGPPFDPIRLADILRLDVSPCDDVREARTVPLGESNLKIEYNPNRPLGRRRYSIAHEIAHTLFPDCGEQIRHRGNHGPEQADDNWQLEALCNIAAAEFLMPIGSLGSANLTKATIEGILSFQRRFEVSTEAVLIRMVNVTEDPCAMFCASRVESGPESGFYKLDYMIGSRSWSGRLVRGHRFAAESVLSQCTAIGYTAKADESWFSPNESMHVECVGIPPYPGNSYPRVVGVIKPLDGVAKESISIAYLQGSALEPRGVGTRVVVQVVNNITANWGGKGFAQALKRKWPAVQTSFQEWSVQAGSLALGNVHFCDVGNGVVVASIVAQNGVGPSSKPKIRYQPLKSGLVQVADYAAKHSATVHMPRIGCGEAGGSWLLVRDLICSTLLEKKVATTVYDLPGTEFVDRQFALAI